MLTGRGRHRAHTRNWWRYWEEAHCEVTQKQGERVDPWAGLSYCLLPGHSFSLGIRLTTYLGFSFLGKRSVASVSLPSLGQSWKVVGMVLERADHSSR